MNPKNKKRKIPATMATQHPDHANKPYWHDKEFISTGAEYQECFLSFSDLGTTEYNWDWEGKLVDESVIERLLGEYFEFFRKKGLGKDYFLTFRIPNPNVENEFRLGRAFMGLLSASGLARKAGMHSPPLFEVILPMTENENQILAIQEAFAEIASLEHRLFNFAEEPLKHIEVIPLFEEVNIIIDSANILRRYLQLHEKTFGFKPTYLRPYVARSDPALNAGIVPTILAIKIALSEYNKFSNETGIETFPMIGCAALPFRGGLTPETVKDFINEYQGIRTTTIQSAFRYDYSKQAAKKGIALLEKDLPKGKARLIDDSEKEKLITIIKYFERLYKPTIEKIADTINATAKYLPKRRERVQHTGLFGYSRGVGKVKLPRAIGFTGSLYSLGVPPELIATGRGLAWAKNHQLDNLILKHYINMKENLIRAGRYLNKENLQILANQNKAWQDIINDVNEIEKYFNIKLGPKTASEKEHHKITKIILQSILVDIPPTDAIVKAAVLRKSLG